LYGRGPFGPAALHARFWYFWHIITIMCQNIKFGGQITRQLCSKMLGEKEILTVTICLPEMFSDHI
jgi:hypothetical protein